MGIVDCVRILSAEERFDSWNKTRENDGSTPVMVALEGGRFEVVEVLVECPWVNVNLRNKEGWTLLMRSIAMKNLGE